MRGHDAAVRGARHPAAPARALPGAPAVAVAAALVGLVVVFGAVMTLQLLPGPVAEPLSYLVQCATVLAACVVMGRRALAARGGLRRARALLSLSLLCATLGGVLALVIRLTVDGAPPVPSVADAVHFLFLPLCVAGLLSFPVSDDAAGSRRLMLLDGAVAAAALWFVTYSLLLVPSGVGADLPLLTAVTILGYPASDVFVIAMAAGALHRVDARAWRELALSAVGVSLYGLSDIAYTVLSAQGAYEPDSWVAALAEAGLVLVLVAALTAGRNPGPRPRWLTWLGAGPHLAVAVAFVFAAGLAVLRGGLGGVEVGLLALVIAGLLCRQLRATRDRDDAITRLRDSRVLFRALVVGSSDLITLHELDGRLRYASPAVSRLTGIGPDEVTGREVSTLVHPDDLAQVRRAASRLRREPGTTVELLLRVRADDGSWRWCRTVARSCVDDPSVQGIVCNTRDVHERHLLEEQVRHDAHHDALTGLGNLARARLALARAHVERDRTPRIVGLLDLDGFKEVNDTHGHGEGDRLLRAVADLLRDCLRDGDEVARTGGDEFLLVLRDDGRAEQVAHDVLARLRGPLDLDGRTLIAGGSIGLSPVRGSATPDEVLRNADLAMYSAKAAGRNRVVRFDPAMHAAAQHRSVLVAELRHALATDGLDVHYQPVVHLASGRTSSVEALVRWRDPRGRRVPPDEFIPVAESAGLMHLVDAWVLDRACRDLASWRATGRDVPQVSVNVSRRQLTPDLVGLVRTALDRHGLDGRQLCLEVTESVVAPDPDAAVAVLEQVRRLGVQVALDDFGTGEACLAELGSLPVDVVKIDRAFAMRHGRGDPTALLPAVIGLCQAVGLPVVVEGVEDAALVPDLLRHGATYGQGYALGRPAAVREASGPVDRVDPAGPVPPVVRPRRSSDSWPTAPARALETSDATRVGVVTAPPARG